jgi:hypothetical protein
MPEVVLAKHAVKKYGEALVGRRVFTQTIGGWPGGSATVTELYHDPAAPDIVLQVKATEDNWLVRNYIAAGELDSDESGVLGYEEIIIENDPPPSLTSEEPDLAVGAIPLQALPEGR